MQPRICRRVELERRLQTDNTMTDERKQRQLQQLGKKESTFLRLRRTRLGLDDFRTVKVIGKGAFGEVCQGYERSLMALKSPLFFAGTTSAEDGYRENIRDEDIEEGGDVEERPSEPLLFVFQFPSLTCGRLACACTSGKRCSCRVELALGCAAFLLLPGSCIPLSHYGVPARRRLDDHAHQIRHFLRGCHTVLHSRVCPGN